MKKIFSLSLLTLLAAVPAFAQTTATDALDCTLFVGDKSAPLVADGAGNLSAKLGRVDALVTAWDSAPAVFNIDVGVNGKPYGHSTSSESSVQELVKAQGFNAPATLLDLARTSKKDEITVSCNLN